MWYWQRSYDYGGTGWRGGAADLPFLHGAIAGVPEVVTEGEAKIGRTATEITVDTSRQADLSERRPAVRTAEVTDQSRRTIASAGGVYAARRPFQTYV